MFDFIEHVRRPRETLSQAWAVMRPGGKLLVSTPRTGSLAHLLSGRFWPQYREEHLVLFSETGLRWALADAGFRVDSVVPTTKYSTGAYLLGQVWAYSTLVPDRSWLCPHRGCCVFDPCTPSFPCGSGR